ncbi:conserved exported hypothetical protein [Hyella patelloides LEGE 07179]|uniref:Superfamily II DNA and RNA helicase n=1 Tax=Hyella patelloides LEGE 07179 TaxID=945734 RepID=A0A563VQ19_9CYAN|nr:hypothetical protein [Hyella patelloides]VEP13562.1 conserved exported hypothetical protein [Hyella patelloides LEGE 07179]
MLRKILVVLMSLSLCWTTVACGGSTTAIQSQPNFKNNVATAPTSIADGKYPVQQATYDDATGEYSLMLLNTPSGTPPVLQTDDVQMARLSEEEVANGEKSYLQVEDKQPILYLTEDFRIDYVHNVTETQTDPQTGQPQTVVVRRESNFWTPFAGAVAGNVVANMLFRPQYYVPPVYSPGGIMTGYGGYGTSYSQAVNRYQERHNSPPPAVKNRQALRTTGNIRNRTATGNRINRPSANNSRSSGSGFGSNTLRTSNKANKSYNRRSTGFGSSGNRSFSRPRSSFGSRRSFGGRRR